MELKTLKDLNNLGCIECNLESDIINPLKKEAITHLKNNQTVEPMPKMNIVGGRSIKIPKNRNVLEFDDETIELSDKELVKSIKVLNSWIRYFFNIKKEDLK